MHATGSGGNASKNSNDLTNLKSKLLYKVTAAPELYQPGRPSNMSELLPPNSNVSEFLSGVFSFWILA
jgi:hypothetical protein